MQLLLVTASHISTRRVEDRLRALGHQALRLETDRFPGQLRLSMRGDGGLRIVDGDRAVELPLPEVLWYRRMSIATDLPPGTPPEVAAGVSEELRSFLYGLTLRARWVMDPKPRLVNAARKPRQLAEAAAAGLDVPATLCTSDSALARAWAKGLGRPIVTKVFSSFALHDQGQQKVVHTTALSAEQVAGIDGLEVCPAVFQELLPKVREYRVTVVGERVFTASLEAQAGLGAVDWRRDPEAPGRWRADTLPEAQTRGLLRLMDRLGLNYGAADFVQTPEGRCVFLEVNPAGEYLWLDTLFEGGISEAIADHLAGLTPRR